MGRMPKNVEFMRTLQAMFGLNDRQFTKACGKKQPNMHRYLSGTLVPQTTALRTSAENLFGWTVKRLMEVAPIPDNLNELSTDSGLYILYDSGSNVLYIGKAMNLQREIRQTLGRRIPVAIRLNRNRHLRKVRPKMEDLVHFASAYSIPSYRLRHNLEALLLRVFTNQTHNSNVGKFK